MSPAPSSNTRLYPPRSISIYETRGCTPDVPWWPQGVDCCCCSVCNPQVHTYQSSIGFIEFVRYYSAQSRVWKRTWNLGMQNQCQLNASRERSSGDGRMHAWPADITRTHALLFLWFWKHFHSGKKTVFGRNSPPGTRSYPGYVCTRYLDIMY